MKKVGLIMANHPHNFGAILQAFATQHIIESMGYQTTIMGYLKLDTTIHHYFDLGFVYSTLKKIIKPLSKRTNKIEFDNAFVENKKRRIESAIKFKDANMHSFIDYIKYSDIVNEAKTCDSVLIGSDQLWIPGTSFNPILSLRFVPNGIKRISYATSLGVSQYPRYCWKSARDMWEKIDRLSVREQQGADIINKVCNGKVVAKVVVDPTYLLTKKQWDEAIPVKQTAKDKYVFCYFLGDDKRSKMCARRYADKYGLKLVYVLSCESYSDIDRTFADITLGGISPDEFVNWIRGAECVFTDSFHGLAFSVINHRQFYVFYRVRKDDKRPRNSRIDNILKMWECEDRLISNPDLDWNISVKKQIDYDLVETIVNERRNDSLRFLIESLA